jgi:hypothetical protein
MNRQQNSDNTKAKLNPSEYYFEGAKLVFTEDYHIRRGYCCGSGCRHCPYEPKHNKSNIKLNKSYESRN